LTEVRDFLNLASTETGDDNFLQSWINNFSGLMEGISGINNKIRVQDVANEIGNGNGRSKYRPLYYPIYAIGVAASTTDAQKLASVQYRDDVDSAWTDIEDDIDHILINNPQIDRVTEQTSYNLELFEEIFPVGTQNIRISYQAGWYTVPQELKLVCLEKVVELYQMSYRKDSRFGMRTKSDSGAGANFNYTFTDFNDRHQKMMQPYKRVI
jgi:hypothetical protein